MADSNKPVRLSKAAREFNLGMTTVVEFLASKGIEVEAKPNTKLDPETYALVKSNFQGDKETKAKAQASAASLQERESITLASAKKRVAPKQEEEEPEVSAPRGMVDLVGMIGAVNDEVNEEQVLEDGACERLRRYWIQSCKGKGWRTR